MLQKKRLLFVVNVPVNDSLLVLEHSFVRGEGEKKGILPELQPAWYCNIFQNSYSH